MRNKRADCASSRLFCTGDVEALGDPNSGAQAEPRIGSLAKIVLTKIKVLTELPQWPRSLFQGTVTSGQVCSLPGPSLVWAVCPGEEKMQSAAGTLTCHLVFAGGVGASGDRRYSS